MLLAVVLLITLSFYWGRASLQPEAGSPPEKLTVGDSPAARTLNPVQREADAAEVVQPPAAAELPPAGTPLLSIFEELQQRARAGDDHAACRLAQDLQTCDWVPANDSMPHPLETHLTYSDEVRDSDVAFLAAIDQAKALARSVCEGVSAELIEQNAWRYHLQAARTMPRAAIRFVTIPPMDPERFLEQRDAWQAYADNAVSLLEGAVARGDPLAWLTLSAVLAGQGLPGMPNAIPADLERAAILYLAATPQLSWEGLIQPQTNNRLERLRANIAAERWPELEREAARLSAQYFSGKPLVDANRYYLGAPDLGCEQPTQ